MLNHFVAALFRLQNQLTPQSLDTLREAGRTLSQANETKIRNAVAQLQEVLKKLDGGQEVQESERARVLDDALLIEAEFSYDERKQAIYNVLRANRYNADGSYNYRYVRDVYDTWFVYEESQNGVDKLFKANYSLDDQGIATFDAPVEVRLQTEYIEINAATGITEAAEPINGDFVRLVEKAVRPDGTISLKIIEPGWGSSAFYPSEVLARDGQKAFPAGTKMFWNHPTATEAKERPERDLNNLAAVTVTDAVYQENGATGPGLDTQAKVFGDYAARVDELAAHIGDSIYAEGTAVLGEAEGRKGRVLTSLKESPFNTIDFVTEPGAGGEVLQLFESARRGAPKSSATPSATNGETNQNPPAQLNESEKPTVENTNVTLTEAQAQDLRNENARLKEALILNESRGFVASTLEAIELPDLTRARLTESLAKAPVLKDGAIDKDAFKTQIEEAAKSELEFAAKAYGFQSGRVRDMGANTTPNDTGATLTEAEKNLEATFLEMGLSESAAKIAAAGR